MELLFPEFFINKEENIDKILNNGIIVFDTNVLLNLYEYSDTTAEAYLSAMETLKEKVWMPNWVIYEFLENRENVICKQENKYKELNNSIKILAQEYVEEKYHPLIDKKLFDEYNKVANGLKKHIEDKQNKFIETNSLDKDNKINRLNVLFSSSIGKKYNEEKLNQIILEGSPRLEQKIPPGYIDYKEKKDSKNSPHLLTNCKAYGDLIIWKQILEYAKEKDTDIFFVTNDIKKDWYDKNKNIQKELFIEFNNYTEGKSIQIGQSSEFLKRLQIQNSNTKNKTKISNESISEIKKLENMKSLEISYNQMKLISKSLFSNNYNINSRESFRINSNIISKGTLKELFYICFHNPELLSDTLIEELKNINYDKSKHFSKEALDNLIFFMKEHKENLPLSINKELPIIIENYNLNYEKYLINKYKLTSREINHGEEEVLFYCPECGHLSYVDGDDLDECLICGFSKYNENCDRCGNKLSLDEIDIAKTNGGLCSYCEYMLNKMKFED